MRRWTVVAVCLTTVLIGLGGCATAPPAEEPIAPFDAPFLDAAYGPPDQPVEPDKILALDDHMRTYLRTQVAPRLLTVGPRRALVDTLYQQNHIDFRYDSSRTRNAQEAFEDRAGNCLSLVLMTAALAKELGLPVVYQSAMLDETWSRTGRTLYASSHVNLRLSARLIDSDSALDVANTMTIDFLPPEEITGMRTVTIDERTVLAMFMNNRAAEALANGHPNDAYWWLRASIQRKPDFLMAYNTLGVVYKTTGHPKEAESVFRQLLRVEPTNPDVMANLASTLETLGQHDEARALNAQLANLEPYPPFYFFDLGRAAMQAGDYEAARRWFTKEVDRAGYYHEFQFWLALADYHLGDINAAREHLALARDDSTRRSDHDLYAAKLDWLRSTQATSSVR